MSIYDVKELRIKRRLAHHAAKSVREIGRTPATDRIRSVAREEARKANLIYAFRAGKNLCEVETMPERSYTRSPFIKSNMVKDRQDLYKMRVYNLLVKAKADPIQAYNWVLTG